MRTSLQEHRSPSHRGPAPWLRCLIVTAGCLLLAAPAAATELLLVSDVPAMDGKQVQRPMWAPGAKPRLVHEMTDRDRSTLLRVVDVAGGSFTDQIIPGARSSRLEAMGAGAERADHGAAWWDETSFFFVRAVGGDQKLFYFDGVPREVPGLPGRVVEVATDPGRGVLFASIEDEAGFDLHRLSGQGFTETRRRLTRTSTEVESAMNVDAAGAVHFVRIAAKSTKLGQAATDALEASSHAANTALRDYEILRITPLADGTTLLYVRAPAGAPEADSTYLLLEVTGAAVKVLANGVYLPPGMPPAPAVSAAGRYVYFINNDAKSGNPVVRYDRTSGTALDLKLSTRGHQEVAVGEYPVEGGMQAWIAVVSVGDDRGQDVRNHLYVGTLAD